MQLSKYLRWFRQSAERARPVRRPNGSTVRLRVTQLEDRTVPSTVSISNSGILAYVAGAGVANNLTISWDGAHTYTFTDTAEDITALPLNALFMSRGSGTHTLTVNASSVAYTCAVNGRITTCLTPNVTKIQVDLGDQANQLNLEGTGLPTVVNNTKGGTDSVVLGSQGASSSSALTNIQGTVSVTNPSGSTSLAIYDGGDSASRTVSMYDGSITGLAPAAIDWTPNTPGYPTGGVVSLTVYGSSGDCCGVDNHWGIQGTSDFYYSTYVLTSSRGATGTNLNQVYVSATSGRLAIDGGNNPQEVVINPAHLNGSVDVYNSGASGTTSLTVYDFGSVSGRAIAMYDGSIYGLSPAPIQWSPTSSGSGGVVSLTVEEFGAVNNTWNVYGTSNFGGAETFLAPGKGTESVNVQATSGRLEIDGGDGNETVTIGSDAPTVGVGTLANIKGSVVVDNLVSWGEFIGPSAVGSSDLIIDDGGDSGSRTVSLSLTSVSGWAGGAIVGLAPSEIDWQTNSAGSPHGGVDYLEVRNGPGSNTVNVYGTSSFYYYTYLNGTGGGHTSVNVRSTSPRVGNGAINLYVNGGGGDQEVTVGSLAPALGGTLANIHGAVDVFNSGANGTSQLLIDDGGDGTARTVTLGPLTGLTSIGNEELTGLAPAPLVCAAGPSGVTSLTIDGGGGGNTFSVQYTAPGAATTISAGGGNNTLVGPNTTNTWTVKAANAGALNDIAFTSVQHLVGGTGVDTFRFTPNGTVSSIDGGGAPLGQGDWLDYSSYPAAVTVNLAANTATGVTGSISHIQNVHGGNHGNTLTGDPQGNILIGGSGLSGTTNTIHGGSGRSILIADLGLSTIAGGSAASASGGDILIAGTTAYDTMNAAHEAALMSILAEWQSGDSATTRFTDINTGTGGGLNGSNRLHWGTTVSDTVKDNGLANTLTATPGAVAVDWFFANEAAGHTKVFNRKAGDHTNNT
jgi:hypothetical protein